MCSIMGYPGLVTTFVPPGWPTGVQPPGSPDFERSAATWLLDVVPSDYLLHGVLKRHPIALASLARHHLNACVEGARSGYRTARSELGPHLPPGAVEAVLAAYRSEGSRLAPPARAQQPSSRKAPERAATRLALDPAPAPGERRHRLASTRRPDLPSRCPR